MHKPKEILLRRPQDVVCLRKDHLSRECKSNKKCFTYGGPHHASICESNLLKTGTREQCAKPEKRENVHPEDQPKSDHSQVTMYISSATPVPLQTAQAIIYKSGSKDKGVKAIIILDNGSQRSHIKNRLKDGLSLPAEYQKTMLIKTFGSQDKKLQTCDAVCIGVKLPNGTDMKMLPYSVSLIC